MTDMENIFICMAAPLMIAAICMGKKYFSVFAFLFAGMGACLLSAYNNTFIAALYQTTSLHASVEIAPVVEEIMKLLPLFFYLLVFEPETKAIKPAIFTVAAGFATFENICYLVQNGADNFAFLMIRGFGTGAMHILSGAVIGYGLVYVWQRTWLKIAGTLGLVGVCVGIHGIYNVLVTYGGKMQYIAYMSPVLIVVTGSLAVKMLVPRWQYRK